MRRRDRSRRARRSGCPPSASISWFARRSQASAFAAGAAWSGGFGVGAHVGRDARRRFRLPTPVLAAPSMVQQHMRHLVREHRGQLGGVGGQRDEAAGDVEIAAGQREGVGDRGIQDGDLVAPRRVVRRRDQAVDGLADQRLRALDRHRRHHRLLGCAHARVRLPAWPPPRGLLLGRRHRRRWGGGLESVGEIAAGRKRERGAQKHRRSQKAAARHSLTPSCTLNHVRYQNVEQDHDPTGRRNMASPAVLHDPFGKTAPIFPDYALLFGHDPIGKPVPTFPDHAFCLGMVLSENRHPLFRIVP